ncbi:hypothetical protein PPTG_07853 [Phytophthora nicotianae INRA-310]|uniref:Endonuclease/exonuclease/phosphatase domain-containing protein n=1 Tax=Phytophthora nicotianae (strain INRA-310) TaxID=761204 RepID=W2QPN5_PHYN3|nr:hypothetical protein PPTG_07853 [Phytophthora nicotianae INRA-310]ETN14215.1 hypothetical protein PPTG_07853 [Phytophthora nicotianae INRA-310]
MWPEPDCPEPAKSTSCKGFPPRYILRVAEQGSKFTGRSPVFFFGTGFRVSTRKSHTALERYLSTIVSTFNRRDITFITGDFNAKLGNRVTGETFLGVHARGRRNRNGHALAAFCDAFQFFAANTAFKKRARNKTTWTQRRNEHIVYNHIDYVLCPQNCRRLCQDAQSWGGTLTASDHKLVTEDFFLRNPGRLRYRARPTRQGHLQLNRNQLIHDDDTRSAYSAALKRHLQATDDDDDTATSDQ